MEPRIKCIPITSEEELQWVCECLAPWLEKVLPKLQPKYG